MDECESGALLGLPFRDHLHQSLKGWKWSPLDTPDFI